MRAFNIVYDIVTIAWADEARRAKSKFSRLVNLRVCPHNRREADIADRTLGSLNWAGSAPAGVASGRTGVRAKAAIQLRITPSPPERDVALLTRLRATLHKDPAAAGSDRRSRSGDDLKRHRVIVVKNRHASRRSRRPL
jgi:hypothetical protein